MKNIIKVCFCAYVPFPFLAWFGKLLFPYRVNSLPNVNEFTFYDLRVFYAHVMPLLFVVALLTQLVIIVPLNNELKTKSKSYKHSAFLLVTAVILVVSVALSYFIWNPSAVIISLIRSVSTLMLVQLIYWIFNLITLHHLEKAHVSHLKSSIS